nr:procyclic acidic repetitive family protein [Streptomyces griseolus]
MIVTLIVLCEVGFWVLLAVGLGLRYVARKPRAGAAVLLCEPLLEVVLLVVTAVDLKNGAQPDWKHGLAAVYIGFTVGLGPSTIAWVDARIAHRFAGGPPPVRPPRYGRARALHEWRVAARWILASAIALVLLQAAVWYVGPDGGTGSLRMWQQRMLWLTGINLVIAASYTLFPKREPEREPAWESEREPEPQPAREPAWESERQPEPEPARDRERGPGRPGAR